MAAEFGMPQWNLGIATYGFADARRIVCAYATAGLGKLATLDVTTGTLEAIETGFTEFGSVRADGNRVVFRGGAPDRPTSIVTLDLQSRQYRILKQATDLLDRAGLQIARYLTRVEPVEFPTTGGKPAFGLFYPPHNPDCTSGTDERPPLLVKCHGGPPSSGPSPPNLGSHIWTSRGSAGLEVNNGGATR